MKCYGRAKDGCYEQQQQQLEWWGDVLLEEDFEVVHQAEDRAGQSLPFTLVPKVAAAVCPHCGTLQKECHQKLDRDGIRDLSTRRSPECRRVSQGARKNARILVLRLRRTASAATSRPLETDHFDRHRRVVSKKGHREFVAAIIDHTNRRVLEVLENLNPEERAELQTLREKFPQLTRLADQRESLRTLFEDRSKTTSEMAQERLTEWLTAARSLQLKPLDAFCQTVENWRPMIANDFTNRSSNGPTEGFNASVGVSGRSCAKLLE
ncbi:MAG: transposase [Planctomycetaceae bacterium]